MIREFSCSNFRNVNIEKLALGRVNILIGPNNSGKTNFIKALTFYSNMLKHANEGKEGSDFLNAMARHGWEHSKNYEAKSEEAVMFEWHMDFHDEPIVYRFAYNVGERKDDFNIILEELNSDVLKPKYNQTFNYFRAHKTKIGNGNFSTAIKMGNENKRIPVKLKSTESVINQFDRLLLEEAALYKSKVVRNEINDFIKELNKSFCSFYCYSSSEFKTEEIRKKVDSKSYEISLRRDGSNLTNLFNHYKNNEGLLWKQKYIENLKLSLRSLVDIDVADLRDFMTLRLLEKNREVELSDVSEGTIKMMLWGMLFCAPSSVKYDLLAIDEPEANLHPAWQKILADNILLSESYEQCVISTHSPDFLDRFTDAFINGIVSVYVFDLQGHINNISYREIAEDLGDWQLGDLYRTQDPALGGWPW